MKPIIKLAAIAAVVLAAGCAHHKAPVVWEQANPDPMQQARDASGATTGQLQLYAMQIRDAVSAMIYAPENYAGKSCTIRLNLARDGMVISARSEDGDPGFCQAALSAVQHAKIPPAPSDQVYQVFKNAPLDFKY